MWNSGRSSPKRNMSMDSKALTTRGVAIPTSRQSSYTQTLAGQKGSVKPSCCVYIRLVKSASRSLACERGPTFKGLERPDLIDHIAPGCRQGGHEIMNLKHVIRKQVEPDSEFT